MKTLKNFSKKLFTSKLKKKKREAKTKRSVWDQHKSSNSQAVQKVYVYRSVFFSDHCIKQIDSTLPRVCSVIDHRGHQNVVKTSVTHSPVALVPPRCFDHILTSSVIYYWTDAWQHGIYLLNWILIWVRGFLVALLYLVSGFSLCSSLSWELRENGVVKNLQFCP